MFRRNPKTFTTTICSTPLLTHQIETNTIVWLKPFPIIVNQSPIFDHENILYPFQLFAE